MADALGGSDFGGHCIPVVTRPVRAVGGPIGAAGHQLRDRGQPARRAGRLRPDAPGDRSHHLRVIGVP